jgi:hypothetical protein
MKKESRNVMESGSHVEARPRDEGKSYEYKYEGGEMEQTSSEEGEAPKKKNGKEG